MLPRLLETVLVATALPATVLALTVSTVVVMTGWRRRRDLLQRQGRPFVTPRVELGQSTLEAGVLDVVLETTAAMRQFESFAAERYVALELAVQPGLAVRTDARAFREIVGDLLAHAIEHSPCGRVLLGALHTGGRVEITVSDDAAHADRALRASELRPAERLAALQGATLEVDARLGQGTIVVLRLPAAASGRNSRIEAEAPVLDPASVWAPAHRAREGSRAERL
jgi:signal transduction histidine kinase